MESLIKEAELNYSQSWEVTSNEYEKLGFYNWNLDQIENAENILEIGGGIGIVTEKIIKKGVKITSIESNESNFKVLSERLKTYPINIIENTNLTKLGKHDCNIIKANFITDNNLNELISKLGNFDTIICWFMGVHALAHMDSNLKEIGYSEKNPLEYRDLIYMKIFSVISKKLPVDGAISLIERGVFFDTQEKIDTYIREFTRFYNLDINGLKIVSLNQHKVENIKKIDGIKMEIFNSDGSICNNASNHVLLSLKISKK
ncbi:rRNA adenine N-6-methyltransferase family protein [Tenacibaculum dicentrarchi]|uniref:rRNA adenine N-6-methyltransferase family protein n=1 Tax=Tenacibaculum dicentrarchi TaxID=669041 RepID=UPI003511F578